MSPNRKQASCRYGIRYGVMPMMPGFAAAPRPTAVGCEEAIEVALSRLISWVVPMAYGNIARVGGSKSFTTTQFFMLWKRNLQSLSSVRMISCCREKVSLVGRPLWRNSIGDLLGTFSTSIHDACLHPTLFSRDFTCMFMTLTLSLLPPSPGLPFYLHLFCMIPSPTQKTSNLNKPHSMAPIWNTS